MAFCVECGTGLGCKHDVTVGIDVGHDPKAFTLSDDPWVATCQALLSMHGFIQEFTGPEDFWRHPTGYTGRTYNLIRSFWLFDINRAAVAQGLTTHEGISDALALQGFK